MSSIGGQVYSPPDDQANAPAIKLASLALYIFPPAAHALLRDYLAGAGNPYAPGNFLAWLAHHPPVYGCIAGGPSYDVGTPETYAAAERAYAARLSRCSES